MSRRTEGSILIDNLLRFIAVTGITATALLAPNAIQFLDKPLRKYFDKLDEKDRIRALHKTLTYIKHQKLVTENYQHGLTLTPKAAKRLLNAGYDSLSIPQPDKWDRRWRIVFFDIPEQHKSRRDAFARKMRVLGFKPLQRSVFIHPFESKGAVATIADRLKVSRYV